MSKGFNLPVQLNVPVEIAVKQDKRISEELTYLSMKQRRIMERYNSSPPKMIRKVGEFLWQNNQAIISYKDISEEFGISEANARNYISKLNFYNGYPMTWIPVQGKVGYIQGSLNNLQDYVKWDIKKLRTITSMDQVKDKAEITFEGKKTSQLESQKEPRDNMISKIKKMIS